MSKPVKWIERFGISDKDFSTFATRASASGDGILRWCLLNGKVPEAEYLDWAMTTYELPAVNGDFFTAPVDHAFWERVKDLYPWNPALFPLSDWDGITMIGCLEPPSNFKFKGPHRFVLASSRHLLLLWNNLQSQKGQGVSDIAQPTRSEAAAEPAPVTFEVPEGLVLDGAKSPEAPAPVANEQASAFPEGLAPADPSAGEGLAPDGLSSFDHQLVSLANFKLPENGLFAEQPAPEGLSVLAQSQQVDLQAEPQVEPSSETATTRVTITNEELNNLETSSPGTAAEKAAEPAEEKPEPMATTTTSFTVSRAEARPMESANSPGDLAAVTLTHILKIFDGAMVLGMDGEVLRPLKWSDLLTGPKNGQLKEIEIETPSIFRIAYRTRLPYHGYVAASPTNTAFFAAFHNGTLPKHVTLTPVLVEKEVQGMLMGISNTNVSYKVNLAQMETLSESFARQLKRFGAAKAA